MDGVDLPALDGQPERSRADPEDTSGFVQIQPSLGRPSIAIVTGDVVVRTQRDDPFASPAIPTPGEEPIPIQDVRQQIIRTDSRKRPHGVDDVL